jgi:regulator of protease activity HflC (stomatin/prohibitin superfamily)
MPFVDRVAYKHSLKEVPLDVPSQVCITKDNTQLQVDGILYFQVTDPMRASYGSSELHRRHHAAGADHAAQRDRQDGAGQDLRGARPDQRRVVSALDEAALNWGVKVLRYEIKDLTPPAEILRACRRRSPPSARSAR